MTSLRDPIEIRFHGKYVIAENGCWEWTAAKNHMGYGRVKTGGKTRAAHRASYQLVHGEIPLGMEIDHLCLNRSCVNPAHLEAVTPQENMRRRYALVTHCVHGHEFTEENTLMFHQNGRFRQRVCRACCRSRAAVRRAA